MSPDSASLFLKAYSGSRASSSLASGSGLRLLPLESVFLTWKVGRGGRTRYLDLEALAEHYNYSRRSGGSGDEESEDQGRAHDQIIGKGKLGIGNPVLLDPKYNGGGEDDDIDSDDAPGSDKRKFSGFKYLGSSTMEEGVNAIFENNGEKILSI
ncbi:hypothetical protein HOY80DRAFT_1039813 [Tuber brumale]|nr:hypothetical protein HOY80DRAFT_1039813 [Tuber brumale]